MAVQSGIPFDRSASHFKSKPFFGGVYNALSGTIFQTSDRNRALYTIEGKWDEKLTLTTPSDKKAKVLFCPVGMTRAALKRPPAAELREFESPRLWFAVGAAIRAGLAAARAD